MSEELDLTLPDRPAPERRPASKLVPVLLVVVILLQAAGMVLVLSRRSQPAAGAPGVGPASLSTAAKKDLALKLEKQGLSLRAAAAWQEYLASSGADRAEAARIWYRIGNLCQDADAHERALAAYYRSESYAKLTAISDEIGRRTQESLESLGKFAALRHELAERVGLGAAAETAGETVVAEIGAQKITEAELDRMIETRLERQLAMLAGRLPGPELARRKEELLGRLTAGPEKLRILNELVLEEILYRQARETRLVEQPEVRQELKSLERGLLARKLIEKAVAEQVRITPGDVETYYKANKTDYMRPARARISHILVATEAAAKALLAQLEGGADFAELAARESQDSTTAPNGGQIPDWLEKGGSVPGIGYSTALSESVFATAAGELVPDPIRTERGYHIVKVREREEARQQTFEAVRDAVARDLSQRKEYEVQSRLLTELKARYDVVIHQSRLMPETRSKEGLQ